jgi:hypothetical protein
MILTPRSRDVGSEDDEKEEEKEKEKDEAVEELPIPQSRQRGGRRVLLPRGSRSWCRIHRRKLSDMVWRHNTVLRRCRRRYLRLLSLGCFGRRLGFRLCLGTNSRVDAVFMLFI